MLQLNVPYTGMVKIVKNAADSFFSNKTQSTVYCHQVILEVGGSEYTSQYCTSSPTQNEIFEGESIDFVAISNARQVYTIKKIVPAEVGGGESAIPLAQTALTAAVLHNQYRPDSTSANVLADADIFFNWFKQKINGK